MVNHLNFKLKYSRFSIIFQFFIGLSLAVLFYQLMPLLWWLVVISLLFISFIFFLKRPQLAQIAYLDKKTMVACLSVTEHRFSRQNFKNN